MYIIAGVAFIGIPGFVVYLIIKRPDDQAD